MQPAFGGRCTLFVPAFVVDARIDHGFAALLWPGLYPTYVVSPKPVAPDPTLLVWDERYSGSRPPGKFSASPASTRFAIVAAPAISKSPKSILCRFMSGPRFWWQR